MHERWWIGAALAACLQIAATAQEPKPEPRPDPAVLPPMPREREGEPAFAPGPRRNPRPQYEPHPGGPSGPGVPGSLPMAPAGPSRQPPNASRRGGGPASEYNRRVPGEGYAPGAMPGFAGPFREADPEMSTLLSQDEAMERQTRELVEKLRFAREADEKEKLRDQLAELVNKHFDVRQQRRELQLKRMEAELGRLRDAIKQRNEARDVIIKDRMQELLGEEKDLGF